MNKPKAHDNSAVQSFLHNYYSASELCRELPRVDDIFSGALSLRTTGNTATRSLSRKTLFQVLQSCAVVDIDCVNKATGLRYAYRTLADYAALARVVSAALLKEIPMLHKRNDWNSLSQARRDLDAPYLTELKTQGLI